MILLQAPLLLDPSLSVARLSAQQRRSTTIEETNMTLHSTASVEVRVNQALGCNEKANNYLENNTATKIMENIAAAFLLNNANGLLICLQLIRQFFKLCDCETIRFTHIN